MCDVTDIGSWLIFYILLAKFSVDIYYYYFLNFPMVWSGQ